MKRFIKNNLLGFILGAIVFGSIGVYATIRMQADQIVYGSGTVADALTNLYSNVTNDTINITENGIQQLDQYSKKLNVSIPQGLTFKRMYATSEYVKNNVDANISVTGLTIGKNYCAIIGRATTGGNNANFDDRGTTFTNAISQKISNYFYNFVPSSTTITITQSAVSFSPTLGGFTYAFVFEGNC